ncbi:MAG: LysR family transcriptional regulator, partial [Afipia sp.]|nr:LysR family transcriptional regulator [Afipia sp.]
MELNQVEYFVNLAETLNFTTAARLSGVSQPSLTRSIRRLEEELGGPLIYRDGKNSRLTALGQEIEKDFKQVQLALRSVRQHSHDWALGSQCVLDIAVAPSVSPNAFTSFFQRALEENPTV